jgi:hypothetical protein
VFKGLSWDYKSNSPCKFGKKIIVDGLVQYDRWGFHFRHGRRREQLADLDRMLNLLDGKPVPENRNDLSVRLDAHIPNSTLPFTKTSMLRYVTSRKALGTSSLNALI